MQSSRLAPGTGMISAIFAACAGHRLRVGR